MSNKGKLIIFVHGMDGNASNFVDVTNYLSGEKNFVDLGIISNRVEPTQSGDLELPQNRSGWQQTKEFLKTYFSNKKSTFLKLIGRSNLVEKKRILSNKALLDRKSFYICNPKNNFDSITKVDSNNINYVIQDKQDFTFKDGTTLRNHINSLITSGKNVMIRTEFNNPGGDNESQVIQLEKLVNLIQPSNTKIDLVAHSKAGLTIISYANKFSKKVNKLICVSGSFLNNRLAKLSKFLGVNNQAMLELTNHKKYLADIPEQWNKNNDKKITLISIATLKAPQNFVFKQSLINSFLGLRGDGVVSLGSQLGGLDPNGTSKYNFMEKKVIPLLGKGFVHKDVLSRSIVQDEIKNSILEDVALNKYEEKENLSYAPLLNKISRPHSRNMRRDLHKKSRENMLNNIQLKNARSNCINKFEI